MTKNLDTTRTGESFDHTTGCATPDVCHGFDPRLDDGCDWVQLTCDACGATSDRFCSTHDDVDWVTSAVWGTECPRCADPIPAGVR